MPGDLVYFVMPARDGERAKRFYGDLLGWRFTAGNVPDGHQIEGTSPPGGLLGGAESPHPSVYFEVGDIDAAVARVRELGGEASEPEEIPSGCMSLCRDDQGTYFNLWSGSGRVSG